MIGAPFLQSMKPGAILVNITRGGVVDYVALVEALKTGPLGHAALYVYTVEPLESGSPLRIAECHPIRARRLEDAGCRRSSDETWPRDPARRHCVSIRDGSSGRASHRVSSPCRYKCQRLALRSRYRAMSARAFGHRPRPARSPATNADDRLSGSHSPKSRTPA